MVREMAHRLTRHYTVEVVCAGSEEKKMSGEYDTTVVKSRLGEYGSVIPLVGAVVRAKPTLIYAHTVSSVVPLVTRMAKSEVNCKVVLYPHYHQSARTFVNGLVRRLYDPLVVSSAVNSANAIIANSKSELLELRSIFHTKQSVFVLHNGVDIEAIRNAPPVVVDTDKIPLLWVSRLEAYKNPIFALEVLRWLRHKYHLYLIGEGPLEGALRQKISQTRLDKEVSLLGPVRDGDLYGWYKSANAFLHFSSSESFGMTCIEALAAGTPVLANDDGHGLTETIDLFPSAIHRCSVNQETPEAVATKVENCANSKPVNVDLRMFDWDLIGEKLFRIIESIMSERNVSEPNRGF